MQLELRPEATIRHCFGAIRVKVAVKAFGFCTTMETEQLKGPISGPFDAKDWMSELLILSQEETHFGCLYRQPHFFGHYPRQ